MLSFRVFVRPNSRRPAPQTTSLRNLRVLRVSALDSSSLHFPLSQVKSSTPCTKLVQYKPIGINTCKSGSKQTTLSTFRINTYEKHRGEGAVDSVPFQRSTFHRFIDLSTFFSYSCALFCTLAKHNSFVSKHFRTLCAKHPGVGGCTHPG